jgi:hypothetical protein
MYSSQVHAMPKHLTAFLNLSDASWAKTKGLLTCSWLVSAKKEVSGNGGGGVGCMMMYVMYNWELIVQNLIEYCMHLGFF